MNLYLIVFGILLGLIAADKIITAINIFTVEKNFPELTKGEPWNIEKNPLAKTFFQKYGIINGSIIYFFISIVTVAIAVSLLAFTFYLFGMQDYWIKASAIMIVIYFLVVAWNSFMYLKFGRFIN